MARQALAWLEYAQYMRAGDAFESQAYHLKQLQRPSYTCFTRSQRPAYNTMPFYLSPSLFCLDRTRRPSQHIQHSFLRLITSAAGLHFLHGGSWHSGSPYTVFLQGSSATENKATEGRTTKSQSTLDQILAKEVAAALLFLSLAFLTPVSSSRRSLLPFLSASSNKLQ